VKAAIEVPRKMGKNGKGRGGCQYAVNYRRSGGGEHAAREILMQPALEFRKKAGVKKKQEGKGLGLSGAKCNCGAMKPKKPCLGKSAYKRVSESYPT